MDEQNTNITDSEAQNISSEEEKYSDNIFKELSGELDFGKEDNNDLQNNEIVKDKIYYLKNSILVLGLTNIVCFFILLAGFFYVNVQNNTDNLSKSFLDPFCFAILGDLQGKNTGDYCSSVSALSADYDKKTQDLKTQISQKVSGLIDSLYSIENFTNSNEVSFLMNEKFSKLKVIDILNDFDKMKNDFSLGDKKMITCDNVSIDNENTLKATCQVYSSSWESSDVAGGGIVGDNGDKNSPQKIAGTSVSIAASFLNFIEKNPKYNFQLIEKQKSFDSQSIIGDGPYVKSTKLELNLKYNNLKNNLSL